MTSFKLCAVAGTAGPGIEFQTQCAGGGWCFLGSREEKRESRSEAVCDSATDTKSG